MKRILSVLLLVSFSLVSQEHSQAVLPAGHDSALSHQDVFEDSVRINVHGEEVEVPSPGPVEMQDLQIYAPAAIQPQQIIPQAILPELESSPEASNDGDMDAQASVLLQEQNVKVIMKTCSEQAIQIRELKRIASALQVRVDRLQSDPENIRSIGVRIQAIEQTISSLQQQIKRKATFLQKLKKCLPAKFVKACCSCFGDKDASD